MEQTVIDSDGDAIKLGESRRFLGELAPAALLVVAWFMFWFVAFALVDPFGVIGWPQIAGFNTAKPLQRPNARIYKPFALLKGDYNGVVLGASRELRGIEPNSAPLLAAGYRLYNFGLVDERPYEAEEIAKFAVDRKPIKTIILDTEFTTYNRDPLSLGLQPYYPKGPILNWAIDQYVRAAVSPQGIADSYKTVIASLQKQRVLKQTPEGREVFPPDPPTDVPYDYQKVFDGMLRHYLKDILPETASQISQGFDHSPLRNMIELAAIHKVRLIAFIAADHALEMEALRRKGLWPLFERWKRELVCVFRNASAMHPDADIALWDFSGYSAVTTQTVPRSGTPGAIMDYLDPIHYAPSLGDRILATVLHLHNGARAEDDFGVELTVSDIEEHLAKIRDAQARYEATHPEEMSWLASMDRSPPPPALQAPQAKLDCAAWK